jgi:hypothetical protein
MMRSRTGTTRFPLHTSCPRELSPVLTIEIIGENWRSETGTTHSRAPEARELSRGHVKRVRGGWCRLLAVCALTLRNSRADNPTWCDNGACARESVGPSVRNNS